MEWLETDGLGGFAMGNATGLALRRYHGLLISAASNPANRTMLVNGVLATLLISDSKNTRQFELNSYLFEPDVVHPHGVDFLIGFESCPWPTWLYQIEKDIFISYQIFMTQQQNATVLLWDFKAPKNFSAQLNVRPLLSGRSYHSLQKFNNQFNFDHQEQAGNIIFRSYEQVPALKIVSDAKYSKDPLWYEKCFYEEEKKRGHDYLEDLASPGVFSFSVKNGGLCSLILSKEDTDLTTKDLKSLIKTEKKRRASFASQLELASESYIVQRGAKKTIIAGYPWFADWGRDTFISMRGFCLATGRMDIAEEILLEWANTIDQGMIPNRFVESGEEPEYNSVDASLWYVISAFEFLNHSKNSRLAKNKKKILEDAIVLILERYYSGTRFNIHCDQDGLLAAGQAGVQLTWMDAKVGNYVVTPRIGKPVEIQALWLNALNFAKNLDAKWGKLFDTGLASFNKKFFDRNLNYLYDVIDVDHQVGKNDGSIRPNQIFAVGGLPLSIVKDDIAKKVVECVEKNLLTPVGLRSLAPGQENYRGRCVGGPFDRDSAYHQGTVWAWLIGPFIEAWIRAKGESKKSKVEARARFLDPLIAHLNSAGLGHISEVFDGDFPHVSRGAPFQAWSVAEALRCDISVLS